TRVRRTRPSSRRPATSSSGCPPAARRGSRRRAPARRRGGSRSTQPMASYALVLLEHVLPAVVVHLIGLLARVHAVVLRHFLPEGQHQGAGRAQQAPDLLLAGVPGPEVEGERRAAHFVGGGG